MDPTSSWLLPHSTAIGWLNEEDTMSLKHLWWGPFTSTFCKHWPEVYKKNVTGHRVQSKKNRLDIKVTLKIDLKVMIVKVMYTLTFHRLLWSILNVCSFRKTKTIQKKSIWSFLRHFTSIFYLSKVTKTIFPQVIFDVKFPALFESAVKNRGSQLRKGSYLHLILKIDLKVKIDGTVKYSPRSWSTSVRTILS